MKDFSSKFLLSGILLSILVSVLSVFGGFTDFNLKIYDQFTKLSMRENIDSNILILKLGNFKNRNQLDSSINSSPTSNNFTEKLSLQQVIEKLSDYKAKSIVIVTQSMRINLPLYKEFDNVFLATPFKPELKQNLSETFIRKIETIPIERNSGIYRQYRLQSEVKSLLNLSHNEFGSGDVAEYSVFKTRYFNSFISPESFPYLTQAQINNGNLVEEVVKDKIVLIDLDDDIFYQNFEIPSKQSATLTELQAIILESYNHNIDLSQVAAPVTVLLVGCLTIFG